MVARKKKQSAGGGRKPIASLLTRFEVPLDRLEAKLALRLGDGDLALGIRRAIVFASIRQLQ